MKEFIIAVYRASSNKVYSFAATYLNECLLSYENSDCPNKGKADHDCENCEDGCPTSGWYELTGDDYDGSLYLKLHLNEGDYIKGWRTVPKWEETTTAEA